VLIEWFSLLSRVDVQKLRKSLALTEKKAYRISLKRKKEFYKVPRTKKAELKSLR